jgi:hypothetical protein
MSLPKGYLIAIGGAGDKVIEEDNRKDNQLVFLNYAS